MLAHVLEGELDERGRRTAEATAATSIARTGVETLWLIGDSSFGELALSQSCPTQTLSAVQTAESLASAMMVLQA